MSFVFISGVMVNLMAISTITFDRDSRLVEIRLIDRSEPLVFGGFDDDGHDTGTAIWTKLKAMASPLRAL